MSESHPQANPWIIAIAVMFATFMEVLDTTVVNVSLPHIAGNLSASVDEAAWVLTSYLVANAIVLPLTGWIASYFGRKRVLLAAVFGFTTASFLCGMAPSLELLVFFRVIQGATGGALQPLSQAVMLEAFPPKDRGKAMAFWGIGLLAVGIGALQVVLDKGQEEDWFESHWITGLAALAAAALLIFIAHEIRARDPVVHLRVFKNRTYSAGVFLMTTMGFVLYGSMLLLPVFLQTLLGYPAVDAGVAMAPRGLGSFLMMPVVGTVLGRFDPRKVLSAGLVGSAWTLWALSRLNLEAGYWDIFWPQFIQGACLAMLFVPLTTATMDPIPKEEMGNATSMFNLMRNVGGSVGIASATTFLFRREQLHINQLGANVTPFNPRSQMYLDGLESRMLAHGADMQTALHQAQVAVWGMVERQASLLSFVDTFAAMAVVFLLVLPLLLAMRKPKHYRGGRPGIH